jgi:hypothetical protein
MANTTRVNFPTERLSETVLVEQIGQEELSQEHAYAALRIVAAAYKAQFEGPETFINLPPGTIDAHFQPEDEAGARRQLGRMATYLESGSSYWFATVYDNDPYSWATERSNSGSVGMIKVSPSRATITQKLKLSPPNMYLNDIAVSPNMQHRRIGTDMLYAVAKWSGYSPDVSMTLDGYANSSVNNWFVELGLQENPKVEVPPLLLGQGQRLEQVRFESGKTSLNDIVANLEQRSPHLLQSSVRT